MCGLIGAFPWVSGCRANEVAAEPPAGRLDGVGLELVVDAMRGEEFLGVEFTNDLGNKVFGQSRMVLSNNAKNAYPEGIRVPRWIQVTWRDNSRPLINPKTGGMTYGGPILGDYKVIVLDRIPLAVDEALARNQSGGLRLKFRLKSDGVLFGWDIERRTDAVEHHLVGGDFQEARIFNGKVMRKGWYIDKQTGLKIETDF